MIRILTLLTALLAVAPLAAQKPLYLVNGSPRDEIASIPPDDIECIEELPADEETIARFGPEATNGVILITLRYDSNARFGIDSLTLGSYIAAQVKWGDDEPPARVALRYKITPDGETQVTEVLEATDGRLKRRMLKAIAEAPRWQPALKAGRPVESEGVVTVRLPEGKPMPGEPYLRIR